MTRVPFKPAAAVADTYDVPARDHDALQDALRSAYEVYRRAMTTWRAAAKIGNVEATERAADGLLNARVALYRSLVATGWCPPPAVEVQLDRDAALVATGLDFDELLATL